MRQARAFYTLSCAVGFGAKTMSSKSTVSHQQHSRYSSGASGFITVLHSNIQRTYSETIMMKAREKAVEIMNAFFA